MDNVKFGEMIAVMRKENAMTQKELAEKLHVTDKAVSKWERGKGYPEITLLPLIADLLGITAGELLNGERYDEGSKPPAENDALVSDIIEFADKVSKFNTSGTMITLISMIFILAGFICLLCNFVINRTINWSLYPVGAMLLVWLTVAPWFLITKHRLVLSFAAFTISLIPYLFLIERLSAAKGWVVPFALPILGITLPGLLIVVLLFSYTKINRISLSAFAVLIFGVFVNLGVNAFVQNYLHNQNQPNISVPITAVSFAVLSIILAVIGDVRRRKGK
ncbi:MAG: helix-turn-helix domain-containing protein [Eubacteriales bacterium]